VTQEATVEIRPEGYQPRRSAGFTLVESVVVLIVLAVLIGAAVPAMGQMLARYQLTTAQLDLIATLQYTRNLAVISGRPKLFCPISASEQCAGDTRWERGWAIGNYRTGNADQLDGPPTLVNVGYNRVVILSTSGRKNIRFQPSGSAGGSTVTFTLCRKGHAEDALALTVSNVGRVASAKAKPDEAAKCGAAN